MAGASPEHLMIAPIVIPMVVGALMLLYDDRQRRAKMIMSLGSAVAMLIVAIELLSRAKGSELTGGNSIGFYLLGDWASPFGIVLVVDRLSAMMLLLTSIVAIPALIYASAGWQGQGQHFHSIFQFMIMGVNGAFLTGDLFNLFVFFEILLAASYGLMLHGSGQLRVRAGLHYIAINLIGALLFLIGVSLIYGVTGTLNMADLATRIVNISEADRPMLHAAAGVLGIAFLIKAGAWPLAFWLPPTYQAAPAPVGAMFAILTKVGIYVILRMTMLLFGESGGLSAGFGSEVLIAVGLLSLIYATAGVMTSQSLGRMAGYSVQVTSATLIAVIGFAIGGGGMAMLGGAMYYMIASTLATAALFLLDEVLQRRQGGIAAILALTADAYGVETPEDDTEAGEVGITIPGVLTVLAISFFAVAIVLSGMPPLPGFIGKFAMLSSGLNPSGLGRGEPAPIMWLFVFLVVLSGFATMIALVRIGMQTFWGDDEPMAKVRLQEVIPIVGLVVLLVLMAVRAHPLMRYTEITARALARPTIYIDGVITAPRVEDKQVPAAAAPMPEGENGA
ncbi:NADH/Ubiquinone/plastoquinone (Complex I) precursor [Ketogulonicigenium robustum]|uniref:NADH/Ubiquinone/plastoquinone (Complex I) n=1 Tax=Ketogulonicigenium robustum TaxID=92947 RepID=A0A1W6NXZ4_9RHOB|nr:monovalent cation/H+ antiporter subunit D [Ketogulonicigenium robustum]ARO14115.1 NADH/Ubiquinone/plastoquinone (Complex I) precursor [Ketogulonicigenium robustum]